MARPRKWRRVCCMPEKTIFGPLDINNTKNKIIMTVDEYEAIRLIDYEGMTQEECAGSMAVARTTVQRIYSNARMKLAQALVEGKVLRIEGGDYELYGEMEPRHGRGSCHRHRRGPKNRW